MEDLLTQLRTLLETNLTDRGVSKFFNGFQAVPAQSDLPLVMCYGTAERHTRTGTVRDTVELDVTIEVQASIKAFFDNETGQGDKMDAQEFLYKIVAERDANGDFLDNTIMSIVNDNLSIGSTVLYTDSVEITYDPYFSTAEFPVAKATVQFTAHTRPAR